MKSKEPPWGNGTYDVYDYVTRGIITNPKYKKERSPQFGGSKGEDVFDEIEILIARLDVLFGWPVIRFDKEYKLFYQKAIERMFEWAI